MPLAVVNIDRSAIPTCRLSDMICACKKKLGSATGKNVYLPGIAYYIKPACDTCCLIRISSQKPCRNGKTVCYIQNAIGIYKSNKGITSKRKSIAKNTCNKRISSKVTEAAIQAVTGTIRRVGFGCAIHLPPTDDVGGIITICWETIGNLPGIRDSIGIEIRSHGEKRENAQTGNDRNSKSSRKTHSRRKR